LKQARFEMNRGNMDQARDLLEGLRQDFPDQEAQDRAAAGIASSYLKEKRYRQAVTSLGASIKGSETELPGSRRLYTAIERRIRRARNRAQDHVKQLEARYDDISWWNVFKLFAKLDRRKDLKEAEKDLDELQDIYTTFEPSLLFPGPMPMVLPELDGIAPSDETPVVEDPTSEATPPVAEEDTGDEDSATEEESQAEEETSEPQEENNVGTDDEKAILTTDTSPQPEASSSEEETQTPAAPQASADGEALKRETAYDVLSDEIQDLVALIPEDRLAEADAILDTIPGLASLSEDETDGLGEDSLDDLTETTSSDLSEVTTQIASTATPPTSGTLDEVAEGSQATPTAGTLELVGEGNPEVAITAPAAPETTIQATPVNSREAYNQAYRLLQTALRSGDQDAIRTAREDYLAAVQAMRNVTQARVTGTTPPPATEGPSAPVTSGSETSPAAPATSTATPQARSVPDSSVTATQGVVRRDRSGVRRGLSDGGLRQSRGSFRR
jgi:tetratricopeptide (TPR) repeat protein